MRLRDAHICATCARLRACAQLLLTAVAVLRRGTGVHVRQLLCGVLQEASGRVVPSGEHAGSTCRDDYRCSRRKLASSRSRVVWRCRYRRRSRCLLCCLLLLCWLACCCSGSFRSEVLHRAGVAFRSGSFGSLVFDLVGAGVRGVARHPPAHRWRRRSNTVPRQPTNGIRRTACGRTRQVQNDEPRLRNFRAEDDRHHQSGLAAVTSQS